MKKCNWVKNKYLVSLVLNLFFLIAAFIFNEIKYEVSDDFVMETILSGAYADNINPHMLFVNVLYGYVLKPMYFLFPGINWYTISLLIWGFIACIGFAILLCNSLDYSVAIFFDFLFLVTFSNDLYILIQFTKTAAMCCIVGSLLVMHGLFRRSKEETAGLKIIANKTELVIGFVLCVIGSWIRMYAIYLIAIFVLIIIIYEYVYYIKNFFKDKESRKILMKKTLIGIGIVGVIFGCYGINKASYKINADYKYYSEYTKVRAAIVDSADNGYEEYATDLQNIGITENDYYMLRSWNFSDPEYFTIEKLQEISNIIAKHNHKKKQSWQNIYDQYQWRKYASYPICMACIILFVVCILWNTKNWKWYVMPWCGTAALLVYFFIRGRVLYRLEYGIFAGTFMVLIYLCLNNLKRPPENKNATIAMLLIAMCGMIMHIPTYVPDSRYTDVEIEGRKWYIDDTYNDSGNYDVRKYRKVVNKADLSDGLIVEMRKHPENVYLLDFNTTIQSLYYDWSAFESLGRGYYKNFCYLSGVTMNFPDVNQFLKKMGIVNPIKDLVKKEVYLIDTVNSEIIVTYLREHYYPNVDIEWVKNIEGYDIWKLSEN